MKQSLILLLTTGLWVGLAPSVDAQDDSETLLEQQYARQAELQPRPRHDRILVDTEALLGRGPGDLLFVGVDDVTISTFIIDPADNNTVPAFIGTEVWGAAVIPDVSPDAVVYFNDGADLFRWQFPNAPALCCSLMFNAAAASVVSVAYDSNAGELLFTRNIATEAVYSLPATAAACPASCDLTQEIVYTSADNDFGGLAYDAATSTLYGTNDDATPGPAGVYEINNDGTTTLVVAYPNGETDIDALAFSNGKLFLVTDEPGDIYVYDVGTATFDAPLTNPWTTSEVFSGAGAGAGLFIPVELQSFTID